MVGEAVGTGGGAAELTAAVRAGDDTAAGQWAAGPGQVYERLALALAAAAPVPLAGLPCTRPRCGHRRRTGRAALAAGARQLASADLPPDAARVRPGRRTRSLPTCLPCPSATRGFDLVLAGFCLNHLVSVTAGLAEARRVGAALAASVFAPGWTHPAKDAVENYALRPFGYQPPAGTHPSLPARAPATPRRWLSRPQPRASAMCGSTLWPSPPGWPPPPNWRPGASAWLTWPRSCARLTRRRGKRPGRRPSAP